MNNIFLVICMVGIISGCTFNDNSARKNLKINRSALFSLNVKDKFDHISFRYQPPGSEKVYIFNPESGWLYFLHTGKQTVTKLSLFRPVNAQQKLVGFTVDEKAEKIRFFTADFAVTYSFAGKKLSVIRFEELSSAGFIYPFHSGFLPVFKNGKMYVPYYPDVEDGSRNQLNFIAPLEAEVDLKSRKAVLLQQSYPSMYRENCYGFGTESSRMEVSEKVHGYLFCHSDSIYLRNIRTGELEVRFFGCRMPKEFEYIPYDEMPSVNENAYMELGEKNPFYIGGYNFPLAGYFGRDLVIPRIGKKTRYDQYTVFADRDFNYVGEMVFPDALLIDSKKGILLMNCENGLLTIKKMSW